PVVEHPGLNLELQRYAALTWRPGRESPIRARLSSHAFVPDPVWLQQLAGHFGISVMRNPDWLRPGLTVVDLLDRGAGEFGRLMGQNREDRMMPAKPGSDFDPVMLCGVNPEMRPAARFALSQSFHTHRDLRR